MTGGISFDDLLVIARGWRARSEKALEPIRNESRYYTTLPPEAKRAWDDARAESHRWSHAACLLETEVEKAKSKALKED